MKFKEPIARQLLFWILLSSSFLTLLITCLHLYVDYQNDISAIEARLHQVETSYLPTITNALWTEDEAQLKVQITGIKNLPEVILVELRKNQEPLFSQGKNISDYTRSKTWPVNYSFDGELEKLGELHVVTDLVPVYQRLADKVLLTLMTQGAKTFIVSFIIFFIVYYLVARHISKIAQSMSAFNINGQAPKPLGLERNRERQDELCYLVDEYNKKNNAVYQSFIELERQKRKAEEVNKLKSEFLANISHEVKTPMNGVYGMAHLLMKTPLNQTQYDYLNIIINSSAHMLDLLNSVLDFSKIEANKLELDIQAFNLLELITELAPLFEPTALEKNLEFSLDIDDSLSHLIEGDSVRLRQVLVNLLSNAFKFTETGRIQLLIQVENQNEKECEIRFSVSDTGIGIPEEKQKMIFGKFSQADNSTTRNFGGTGLGLAICHHLVNIMGGQLKVESKLNEGCRFYFSLTFSKSDLIVKTKEVIKELVGLNVLIVDDYAFNTRVMAELITEWQMTPVTINDPKLAIPEIVSNDANSNGFDFIMIDKCMPELSGLDVCQQIQELKLVKPPKVIMTSAQGVDIDMDKKQELGIDAFIPLPSDQSFIRQTMLDLIATSSIDLKVYSGDKGASSTDRYKILVVEDSRINQQVCCAAIKQIDSDMQVILANNGEEAIELWQQNSIDLVLMDCHMPVMDGFDATQRIRELESDRQASTPIIAVTASNADHDKQRCVDAGMDDFIAKPYIPEEIDIILKKYISSDKQLAYS
mgnify:CR=1 FL=1